MSSPIRALSGFAAVLVAVLCASGPALASQAPPPNALTEAQRLRDVGDFAAAARILREQLTREPNNGDAARLLAQTLYWLQDFQGARSTYEAALVRHPQDTAVRLEYGRMLVETGDAARAREVLTPLQRSSTTQAEASVLLGTLGYWQGDLTTAADLFEQALRADPSNGEARRQLGEIRAASAPWLRVSSGFGQDDQPLDRLAFGVEAGWFATPLSPVTVRVEPMTYRLNDSATRRFLTAEAVVSHFMPALRLDAELMGGVLRRPGPEEGSDWKGRAMVGVRLPGHVALRARAERSPYLYTTSSLDTPVVAQVGTALLSWQDPRGWLAEAAYQHQRFPDGNAIRTVYGWQLVPLVHRTAGELQVGYAFAREHADETRFVLASPTQPFQPGDPRFSAVGRYSPYYTPDRVVSHSIIAATAVRSRAATLRLGGAYAVHATEDAPAFVVTAGRLQLTATSREFSPWNARASLEVALGGRATLTASGERSRTAFYEWSAAGLQVTYRFRPAP
jgi:tetratricopeptide (TPR) repeat protein